MDIEVNTPILPLVYSVHDPTFNFSFLVSQPTHANNVKASNPT